MRAMVPKLGQPVWVLLNGILFTHLAYLHVAPFFRNHSLH